MANFFKIARMPRVIGAVDGSLIPIGLRIMTNTCMSAIRAFMPSMPWQCAMHNFLSLTLCADGRDLFTIQQYSMAACSMHTLKMEVGKMAGCLGIMAMGSSHIY